MKKIVIILVIVLSLLMCSCEDGQSNDVNITNQVKQTDYNPDVTVTNDTQVNDMPENTPPNETTPTQKSKILQRSPVKRKVTLAHTRMLTGKLTA